MKREDKHVNDINLTIYSKENQELIKQSKVEMFRYCKDCDKYYPKHTAFFRRDIRLGDDYFFGKCWKCRTGKFKQIEEKGGYYIVDSKLSNIENHIKLIESGCKYTNPSTFVTKNYKELLRHHIDLLSDDEVYNLRRQWFFDHKLSGVLVHKFAGKIYLMLESVYGDKYLPWKFTTCGRDFRKDKKNIDKCFWWLMDQLVCDNVITNIEDIPSILTSDIVKGYDCNILMKEYKNVYTMIDYYYPNKFMEYEYYIGSYGSFTLETYKEWMRDLVYNKLDRDVDHIPYFMCYSFIRNSKYARLLNVIEKGYYDSLEDWVIDTFKDEGLDIELYLSNHRNHYITYDNLIAKSQEERMLYYIFLNNNINVELCSEYDDRYLFYNYNTNKRQYPDYIIHYNGTEYIVEYYGLMNSNGNFSETIGYAKRHRDKHVYYRELCSNDNRYSYIDLYQDDLMNDRTTLVDKFKAIGIELEPYKGY